jgi:hypothetical protein
MTLNRAKRGVLTDPTRLDEGFPHFHMFIEDVQNAVMPYAGFSRSGGFSVSIGEDPAAVELLQSLARNDHSYSPEALLCNAVNEIALPLAWHGRAVYQITPDETNDRIFRLRACTSKRLYKLPGYFVHHVPIADRKEFPFRFIVTSSINVWDVSMPSRLGGPRNI